MGSVNFHTKEILLKIVYYGPGLCGKTSSLHAVYNTIPEDKRPQLVSLATETDRTLYFDLLPIRAAQVRDMDVRLQLYTVPGQVYYRSTREIVLRGVDGIVFVADSQPEMLDGNLVSLEELSENLQNQDRVLEDMPLVFQFNKRDLAGAMPISAMESQLNYLVAPVFSTVASEGTGVMEALQEITKLTLREFVEKNRLES